MKRMLIFVLLILCGAGTAFSQSMTGYTERLSQPESMTGAKAMVTVDSKSSAALRAISPLPSDAKIPGFRVCVFFDNGQTARAAGQVALRQLETMYPSVTRYMVYPVPTFKVLAGDCLSRAEATHLMGILRSTFPKAFIVNEMIPLQNFIQRSLTITRNDVHAVDTLTL